MRQRVTQREAALLACLMEADGAVVTYADLGQVVGSAGVNDRFCIHQYLHRMRMTGIDCVETVAGRGLRMTEIPPDWALEDVLAVLRSMQEIGIQYPQITRWRWAS